MLNKHMNVMYAYGVKRNYVNIGFLACLEGKDSDSVHIYVVYLCIARY